MANARSVGRTVRVTRRSRTSWASPDCPSCRSARAHAFRSHAPGDFCRPARRRGGKLCRL